MPDHPPEARLAATLTVERDRLARINEKCPELSREELSDRLAEILGVEPTVLETELERVGGELAYLLNEDRGLREHFVRTEATALSGERRSPIRRRFAERGIALLVRAARVAAQGLNWSQLKHQPTPG